MSKPEAIERITREKRREYLSNSVSKPDVDVYARCLRSAELEYFPWQKRVACAYKLYLAQEAHRTAIFERRPAEVIEPECVKPPRVGRAPDANDSQML